MGRGLGCAKSRKGEVSSSSGSTDILSLIPALIHLSRSTCQQNCWGRFKYTVPIRTEETFPKAIFVPIFPYLNEASRKWHSSHMLWVSLGGGLQLFLPVHHHPQLLPAWYTSNIPRQAPWATSAQAQCLHWHSQRIAPEVTAPVGLHNWERHCGRLLTIPRTFAGTAVWPAKRNSSHQLH